MTMNRTTNIPIRKRRTRAIAMRLGVVAVVIGVVYVIGLKVAPGPPHAEMDAARSALARARKEGADLYSPRELEKAAQEWIRMMTSVREENDRFFSVRDYDRVLRAAVRTRDAGQLAYERSRTVKDSLYWTAVLEGSRVREQLALVELQLDLLPRSSGWSTELAEARSRLGRSEGALRRRDLLQALGLVRQANQVLGTLGVAAGGTLDRYLEDMPEWKTWADDAIASSRETGGVAVIVDKMARKLYLYRGGRLEDSWDVELGPSWMGTKRHEGDLATPEGRYKVRRRRGSGSTTFFRALELDYPNPRDIRRFENDRRTGALPEGARIGGLIEIHGEGGKGADWTRGCIALANNDMEALFNMVPTGSPVVIVGSLEPPSYWSTIAVNGIPAGASPD